MKKLILATIISIVSITGFALEVKQNPNDVSMAISITDNKLEVQMEAPMELVLGFSNRPESKEELQKWSELQSLWFNHLDELISLKGYNCVDEESSIEYEIEDDINYGEVLAKVVKRCNKEITKANITIKIKSKFSSVEKVQATIFMNDTASKTMTLDKKVEHIKLY